MAQYELVENKLLRQLADRATHRSIGDFGLTIVGGVDLELYAKLVIEECVKKCQKIADDADFMTKSEFVTPSGRLLHEGMWGGATNCANEIKQHFGIK